jgi:hypothetical protein
LLASEMDYQPIEMVSADGQEVALAFMEEDREDSVIVAFMNRTTGEIREQLLEFSEFSKRWRENAVRRMSRRNADSETPRTLLT